MIDKYVSKETKKEANLKEITRFNHAQHCFCVGYLGKAGKSYFIVVGADRRSNGREKRDLYFQTIDNIFLGDSSRDRQEAFFIPYFFEAIKIKNKIKAKDLEAKIKKALQ